mmetsp:Transcript_107410/g.213249  ORF Transcript_107410/g.213249 Transcript_107410/m.213249 type:complete len:92 (-) Transcript_107410:35-310(-)
MQVLLECSHLMRAYRRAGHTRSVASAIAASECNIFARPFSKKRQKKIMSTLATACEQQGLGKYWKPVLPLAAENRAACTLVDAETTSVDVM